MADAARDVGGGKADQVATAGGGRAPADVPDVRSGAALRSLGCPRCAGPLSVLDGDHLIRCRHCGTRFLTRSPGGFDRRFFPVRVERLTAVGKASVWLRQHPDTPSDIADSAFVEATLVYVPIWEVRAHVVGWEFGKRLRNKTEVVRIQNQDVLQTRLVDEGVESGFLGERRMYQEAADLASLGISRPLVTGRETTVPYLVGELEREAVVLEADRDLAEVQARAESSFLNPPTGTLSRQTKLFLIRRRSALLYYPVWALRYGYKGRVYEMTVDGRTGLIHSARAPADNRKRLAALLASYAALAVALALAVSAWEAWEGFRDAAFYSAVLVLVVASGVYWRFRLIREVEYHEPYST